MAKMDTVYSMFGLKTPQQVAIERLKQRQNILAQADDGFGKAGAAIGMGLARLFSGPDKEMELARKTQQEYTEDQAFMREVEQEAAQRGMPELTDVQQLTRRANQLDQLATKFEALGQPMDKIEAMRNSALATRMQATEAQRAGQKFDMEVKANELTMDVNRERLEQLQERNEFTPQQLAEIQLKATPESYANWIQGKGTLVPNPKATGSGVAKAIEEYEYFSKLGPEERERYLLVKRASLIRDLGGSYGLINPIDQTVSAEIPKTLAPADQPETIAQQKEAEVTAEAKAEKKLSAPAAIANLEIFDNALVDLKNHPGFTRAFGFGGETFSSIPGTDAAGALGKLEQVQSLAFLNQIPQMKGFGALSNAEGVRLSSALSSLKQQLAPEEAAREIDDVRRILGEMRYRLENPEARLTPEQVQSAPLAIRGVRTTQNGVTYKIIGSGE